MTRARPNWPLIGVFVGGLAFWAIIILAIAAVVR